MRHILNTTFFVEEQIESTWMEKMRIHYRPSLLQRQLCRDLFFSLGHTDETQDGKSFSLQIIFDSKETLNHYFQHEQTIFLQSLKEQFGEHVLYFCTILEEVEWKN